MELDCIILDFDGTFTDVEKEAVPFLAAYREDLTAHLGPEVTSRWEEAAGHIGREPERFGWEFEGQIVAPSHADPYVMATSIAQRLLDDAGLMSDPEERGLFLEKLFRANYPKAAAVFRPEAKGVVESILRTGRPVFVVTNSHTEAVQTKIEALAPEGAERLHIYGNAKKYVISEPEKRGGDFASIPAEQRLDGLARPILLRRGHYYDQLRTIAEEANARPQRTLVCGDIYELDLALPAELDYIVHLVARPGTPAYERRAVSELPRGAVSETLDALRDRFELP